MNKVDEMVKALLLEYPTLYSSRIDVLYNIFISGGTGAGYEWDENGCIYNRFGTPDTTEMKYDDLDERQAQLDKDVAEQQSYMVGIHAMRQAEIDIERKTREIIAANIDVFATEKTFDQRIGYETLEGFYVSEYGILSTAPYGKLDSDWMAALEEVLETIRLSFNRTFSLHYDAPLRGEKAPEPSMFSRMPKKFQTMRTYLNEVEEKVEAQSGKREQMRSILNDLFNELDEEANANL